MRSRVNQWMLDVQIGSPRWWCEVIAGLHLAAAYVYGLMHWPFATILVAAIYFMIVLHRLEGESGS